MPTIGDKFKHRRFPRRTFSFTAEQRKGTVVWWDFFDMEDGKYHAFYPDEVVPCDQYHVKRVPGIGETPYIEPEREIDIIFVDGEEVYIL